LDGTDREGPVCNRTRENKKKLGKNKAVEGLHDDEVTSLVAMKSWAAVEIVFVLLPVDLRLIDNLD
jgi:hypothetical protein